MKRSPARLSDPSPQRASSQVFRILTYAGLVFWSLVCLFPLYWVAVTSLKGGAEIVQGPYYLPFVDFTPTLDAWATALTYSNDHLLRRFFNSAVVGTTSTLLTVLFGGLAVYGLTRFRVAVRWLALTLGLLAASLAVSTLLVPDPGARIPLAGAALLLSAIAARYRHRGRALQNDGILFAILASRILPPAVIVLPLYLMAARIGARETYFGLIFTYTATNLPVAVWLLLPVFGNAATAQEEAAQIDGASHLRIFFSVFLPMVKASMVAVGLVIFILCWNEYLFAVFLAGDRVSTLPPWVIGQVSVREAATGGDTDEWSRLSAAILLMVAPLLAFAPYALRILVRAAARRGGL